MNIEWTLDVNKLLKAAERNINTCITEKEKRKNLHIYITINGEKIELKEPVSFFNIEIIPTSKKGEIYNDSIRINEFTY